MLIGGGLIQFAAVVDQWWITFPSFGCSLSLWGREDLGGGNNSGGVEPTDNVPLCSTSSTLPILRENNKNVFSDNVYCVTDGSSQWNRAEITRSDIVLGSWQVDKNDREINRRYMTQMVKAHPVPGKRRADWLPAASVQRSELFSEVLRFSRHNLCWNPSEGSVWNFCKLLNMWKRERGRERCVRKPLLNDVQSCTVGICAFEKCTFCHPPVKVIPLTNRLCVRSRRCF